MATTQKRSARDVARITGTSIRLDHVTLTNDDVEWLNDARSLIFWNVKFPDGFLSQLPKLEALDYRGGSGTNASFIDGCGNLERLSINQVRGLSDLSAVTDAVGLRFLDLYGLPRVLHGPSLAHLTQLDRLQLGSMKGLVGIAEFLEAPSLREIYFAKMVGVTLADADAIAAHASVERFGWFPEDVPDRVFVPFFERVGKPRAEPVWQDPARE